MEKAMSADTIKISEGHTIRTKAINERYEYNITDEIEAYIMEEYPHLQGELIAKIKQRRKEEKRVTKEVVNNIVDRMVNGKKYL